MAKLIDHIVAATPMASKRSRKDGKKRQDAHVRACKAERRRQKIKECRDYKTYERRRKGGGRVKRIRIKQLTKLIRDALRTPPIRTFPGSCVLVWT